MSFSNTVDYANRAGKKRPLTFRNIRRLAERALDKQPTAFIKIIGDALGLIKFFYNLPPEDPECQQLAGRLFYRAKARHAELGIEMVVPKRPADGPPDMEGIDATPPLASGENVALDAALGVKQEPVKEVSKTDA